MLVKQGFHGPYPTPLASRPSCWTSCCGTPPTFRRATPSIKTSKNQRAGRPMVEPLYTVEDAEAACGNSWIPASTASRSSICDGVRRRASSTPATCWALPASRSDPDRGRRDEDASSFPAISATWTSPSSGTRQFFTGADYVVMESTYGDRNHTEVPELYRRAGPDRSTRHWAGAATWCIPAFAVGRTQELLYFIREIKDKSLVKSVKDFPVYVDSPLAKRGHHHLLRRPAGLSGRGGAGAGAGAAPICSPSPACT